MSFPPNSSYTTNSFTNFLVDLVNENWSDICSISFNIDDKPSNLWDLRLYDAAGDHESTDIGFNYPCVPDFWHTCHHEMRAGIDLYVREIIGIGQFAITSHSIAFENCNDSYRLVANLTVNTTETLYSKIDIKAWTWGIPDVNLSLQSNLNSLTYMNLRLEVPITVPRWPDQAGGFQFWGQCVPNYLAAYLGVTLYLGDLVSFPSLYPPFDRFVAQAMNFVWPLVKGKLSSLGNGPIQDVLTNLLRDKLNSDINPIKTLLLDPTTVVNGCPQMTLNTYTSGTQTNNFTYSPSSCQFGSNTSYIHYGNNILDPPIDLSTDHVECGFSPPEKKNNLTIIILIVCLIILFIYYLK